MPSVSSKQQKFMALVYAAKKHKLKNPSKKVEEAASSMSANQAHDFMKKKAEDPLGIGSHEGGQGRMRKEMARETVTGYDPTSQPANSTQENFRKILRGKITERTQTGNKSIPKMQSEPMNEEVKEKQSMIPKKAGMAYDAVGVLSRLLAAKTVPT